MPDRSNGNGRGGGGRPKGAKSVLPHGTVKLIEIARQAELHGIKTDEAYGLVLQVMRGEVTGRHLRDRLSAAYYILDQEIGKAKQKVEVTHRDDGVYQAEFADGATVHPAPAAELPN